MGYRSLVLVMVMALGGCGEVKGYTDAGTVVEDPKDAAVVADGPSCNDQTCGGAVSDGCCPDACNGASDADCPAVCDNDVVEPGEICDPLASCPTACPQISCQLRTLSGGGTCAAECVNAGQQTACSQATDGCCPGVCNATNDVDCAATCNNSVLETGEQCDPLATCPTSCPAVGCTTYDLFDGGTCQAQCIESGSIAECTSGDGCCPGNGFGACTSLNDTDCAPQCGNGTVESGENCEGAGCTCGYATTCFTSIGGPDTCNIACPNTPIQECGPVDDCCPYIPNTGNELCNRSTDSECLGPVWRQVSFNRVSYQQGCTTVVVNNIERAGSYLFTTCAFQEDPGYGDPVITEVRDNNDRLYSVTNDDCNEPSAIPRLAGWSCNNNVGALRMSCASPNDGGFRIEGDVFRLFVTVCPFGGNQFGHAPFHVWYNATDIPQPEG